MRDLLLTTAVLCCDCLFCVEYAHLFIYAKRLQRRLFIYAFMHATSFMHFIHLFIYAKRLQRHLNYAFMPLDLCINQVAWMHKAFMHATSLCIHARHFICIYARLFIYAFHSFMPRHLCEISRGYAHTENAFYLENTFYRRTPLRHAHLFIYVTPRFIHPWDQVLHTHTARTHI